MSTTILRLVDGPVPDPFASAMCLQSPAHGAVCSFLGVVRNHHHGRQVAGLHYQCYASMALVVLGRLAEEVRERCGADAGIVAVHAGGDLLPGQLAVAMHVACAHREAAFTGCRHLIERIKEDLPVWKHERYADGTSQWLKGS